MTLTATTVTDECPSLASMPQDAAAVSNSMSRVAGWYLCETGSMNVHHRLGLLFGPMWSAGICVKLWCNERASQTRLVVWPYVVGWYLCKTVVQ